MVELTGKRINSIRISEDDTVLGFETSEGVLMYRADGECCSETWFEEIIGVEALLGDNVNTVEEIPMVECGGTADDRFPNSPHSLQDYDNVYGYRLTTDMGQCDIIFRNSSNGFYGGWCSLHNPYMFFGQNEGAWEWRLEELKKAAQSLTREITEDWQA